jgi:hypothetical protein
MPSTQITATVETHRADILLALGNSIDRI